RAHHGLHARERTRGDLAIGALGAVRRPALQHVVLSEGLAVELVGHPRLELDRLGLALPVQGLERVLVAHLALDGAPALLLRGLLAFAADVRAGLRGSLLVFASPIDEEAHQLRGLGDPPVVGRLLLRDLLLLVDDLAVQAGERAVVFAILVGALTPLPGQVEVLGGHRALHRLRRFGALGFVLLATGSEQQRERERASARGERGASNQGGARGHAHSFRQAYHSGLVYVAWIAGAGPSRPPPALSKGPAPSTGPRLTAVARRRAFPPRPMLSPSAMSTEPILGPDPFSVFFAWYEEAVQSGLGLPDAMALATADASGQPSVRVVLFKGVSGGGFRFFTNYDSRKAQDIQQNPKGALVFYWSTLHRQVRAEGAIERLDPEESDEYFRTRPRESQL